MFPQITNYEKGIIVKISNNIIIDNNGLRVVNTKGSPINNDNSDITPIDEEYLKRAKKYISLLKKSQKINHSINSYSLKHRAENYLNYIAQTRHKDTYVSNGALISAMILSGFNYKCFKHMSLFEWKPIQHIYEVDEFTSINVCFNVFSRQIKDLNKKHKI